MERPPARWFMRFQWGAHRLVWNVSGGRIGRTAIGMPVLELETTGWKSGEARRILITYVETGDGPALAGTNAGAASDPAWVKNLRANPLARIRSGGPWRAVEAEFAEGAEWQEIWDLFREHPGYADYERILDRPVPIVVLRAVG